VATDLFDKCANPRIEEFRLADQLGVLPFFLEMRASAGPVIIHQGRPVVMLGSNNYLGLTQDERVIEQARKALEAFGSGCTGSRLMNGTLAIHRELEEELADWVGVEAALVFTTGYLVNLGAVSTLISDQDVVFLDQSSHASLVDGARLSGTTPRFFRHNSAASLARRLHSWRRDHEGGALVAVDGVYSMEGDVAPVGDLAAVCSDLGARFLVDEAHAIGLIGPEGAGVAAAAGVAPDLVMGTFSKSLASCGGFLGGSAPVMDFLKVACRPFLFTASGVPAALGAALAAVRIARSESWRREKVFALTERLRSGLDQLGFKVQSSAPSAIVPIYMGDDWTAARAWRLLLDAGVYVNCAVAPAVPKGGAVLRASVMATHDEAHIDRALAAFEGIQSALD
jgi:8-amino-7-oxononanoate synthase